MALEISRLALRGRTEDGLCVLRQSLVIGALYVAWLSEAEHENSQNARLWKAKLRIAQLQNTDQGPMLL